MVLGKMSEYSNISSHIPYQWSTTENNSSYFPYDWTKTENHTNNSLDFQLNLPDFETPNLLKKKGWQTFIILLFGAVIILGFIENLIVFIVIMVNKRLHTVTNIFISCMTVSDILLCAFNLPFQLHYGLTDYWSFGKTLCHIIIPMFAVPVFVSTLAMLMIAVERYILIVLPFRKKLNMKMALLIVFLIVTFSILCSIPIILHSELKKEVIDLRPFVDHQIRKSFCIENWPLETSQVYTMFAFLLQFVIPYIIISILYFQIYRALKRRPIRRKETRKNYQTTRILVAITVLFTLSWLPFQTFSIIIYFNPSMPQTLGSAYKLTDLLLIMVAMSSACINPFLYGWLNDNFRKEFRAMLGKSMKKLHVSKNGYFLSTINRSQTSVEDKNLTTINL